MNRKAEIERQTRETQISVALDLDGDGNVNLDTGIPFLDHMLHAFARHGYSDLEVKCQGDLEIDAHHTMEDIGLVLGQALKQAVGDRSGICRFGHALIPMDESLVRCVLDLSGRPFCAYNLDLPSLELAGLNPLLFREFFRALTNTAGLTFHLTRLAGDEPHHIMEAAFKSFGVALDLATRIDQRCQGAPSSKGVLD
jgi:imidazoleglycerol-phosphate dehydratase